MIFLTSFICICIYTYTNIEGLWYLDCEIRIDGTIHPLELVCWSLLYTLHTIFRNNKAYHEYKRIQLRMHSAQGPPVLSNAGIIIYRILNQSIHGSKSLHSKAVPILNILIYVSKSLIIIQTSSMSSNNNKLMCIISKLQLQNFDEFSNGAMRVRWSRRIGEVYLWVHRRVNLVY